MVYDQVRRGEWTVNLSGLAARDRIVHRSGDRRIEVRSDAKNEYSIDLE